MSARQLPPTPSLRHLKNEAKTLHRSIRQGDREAASLARTHLRRLADLADEEVGDARVTLQETQHVLARDYGFAEWSELVDAIEPGAQGDEFEAIADLPPRDAEVVLRKADHWT